MGESPVHDEPVEVAVDNGVVVIKCPQSVAMRLTATAAEETSHRLLKAAMKVRGQRYFDEAGS